MDNKNTFSISVLGRATPHSQDPWLGVKGRLSGENTKVFDSNVPVLSLTLGICYLWQSVDPCWEKGMVVEWGTRTHAPGYWKPGREGIL